MIKQITDAVAAQLKKYLKPQMNNIDAKLDRINNRISNVESYMELQQMVRGYELMLSKFDNDISDILNPKQTLKKPEKNRRPGQ
ncbi:MAG: hypothetical protein M0Z70_05180 [Nitrospiraceae bacterium]|nr:hypothetical protein [Nitrospiraceae bacterium]